jgi:hypothetical protein
MMFLSHPSGRPRRTAPLRAALLLAVLAVPGVATGSSSSSGEEYLSVAEAVEPNVLFVVDLSELGDDPCPVSDECFVDEAETIPCPGSTDLCIDEIADAIGQVTQHYDWARYGVVGTTDSASDDGFFPIAPLGSTHADIANALSTLGTHGVATRNLGEVLAGLADDYFSNTTADDGIDDDGDGFAADWGEAPVQYYCQENHVIYVTIDRSEDDEDPDSSYIDSSISPDIVCDQSEITSGTDEECLLDNVAGAVYDADLRADLDDTQNLITHVVAVGVNEDSVANYLFGNAVDQTDGEGIFTIAQSSDQILGSILTIMADIRSGFHSRSTPVLTSDGEYLIYSFYELDGSNPLAEGHVRAYTIETDPSDPDYGQVEYLSGDPYDSYGGAYWDAGTLLQSRPVFQSDDQDADMDGDGLRDLFTFVDEMASGATSYGSIARTQRRMDFDVTFVDEVARVETTLLPYFLDNADDDADGHPDDTTYDLNTDDAVDYQDLQTLVDFARGYHLSTFRYLEDTRGYWKLGDSPHSTPAVVEPRNDTFSVDPTYRTFLATLETDSTVPAMVYIAANDGMLHAFYLEDDTRTVHSEQGEEAWAWIPSYLLYWDHESMHGITWPGRLLDQMLYGRTFLMDGTPVVDDVWLDSDGDGQRECDQTQISSAADLLDHCEWHRVLVVQQGKGGPVTMALDITDPLDPRYLWEQVDLWDPTAQGYTVGRPVIAKVYDDRDVSDITFRWVAIWGSGRAVTSGSNLGYFQSVEANLYMWAIGDDYLSSFDPAGLSWDGTTWDNSTGYRLDLGGNNGHPENWYSSMKELRAGGGFEDLDDHYEHAYISATPAVVDADNDGDADVVYFPVTTTYGSRDDDTPTPKPYFPVDTQRSGIDYKDPGDTWIWKAMIDLGDGTAEEDLDIQWCPYEFFDPKDATITGLSERPPVYYAITTSWMYDGSLGLYWGTGSPYERYTTDPGYFFAVKDPSPLTCGAAVGIECDGETGLFELGAGEGLTADPIVYAGIVFFSTYQPNTSDMCQMGTGRVYGISYEDCSPALGDIDGDGIDDYSTEVDGYPSQVAISDQGTVFIGTSAIDDSTAGIITLSLATDPLQGTQTISWMEIF